MKITVEFSKFIFWAVFLLVVGVTIFGCMLMWRTSDTSALAYLIPAVFAEFATATGFYFWKAKNENRIKLLRKYNLKIEKEDIER